MKVILQQNVLKLGNIGDVVETAPGYFRNFLQPRGLAVLATEGTLKKRGEDVEYLKKKVEQAHQETVALAERINVLGSIKLYAKSGDGGKLYGKITHKEIALAVSKELGVEINKRLIKSAEDIAALGAHNVQFKLSTNVQAELIVEVLDQSVVA